jgi:hypothetical protein
MNGSVGAQAVDEPAGRCVEVEQADRLGPCDAEAVHGSGWCGDERPWPGEVRLVTDAELDQALEHVEGVRVIGVRVRVDALELGPEGHVDRGELRQVAEDVVLAGFVLDRLGVGRRGEDGIGERTAAVGRGVMLVEARIAAAHVVAEAERRDVEVEEDRGRVARVPERVHDVRRGGGEHPGLGREGLALGPERDLDLTFEDVERVGVVLVDVGVGPLLAGLVAEPRNDQLLEVGQDPQRSLRPVGDELALAGS